MAANIMIHRVSEDGSTTIQSSSGLYPPDLSKALSYLEGLPEEGPYMITIEGIGKEAK